MTNVKRFSVMLFLLTILLVVSGRRITHAQTTLGQVRDKVDQKLVLLWNVLLLRQIGHYQMYGSYFQGMITHSAIPADGTDVIPDNWGSKPTDQMTNWLDFWGSDLPADLPMAIVIDTYSGPLGSGFTATVYASYQGIYYTRSKSIGPESRYRTKQWDVISVLPFP